MNKWKVFKCRDTFKQQEVNQRTTFTFSYQHIKNDTCSHRTLRSHKLLQIIAHSLPYYCPCIVHRAPMQHKVPTKNNLWLQESFHFRVYTSFHHIFLSLFSFNKRPPTKEYQLLLHWRGNSTSVSGLVQSWFSSVWGNKLCEEEKYF